uniref:Uncharacterized protein n=1 Tax=CrAss-like virus sp. ctXt06 TaxID=2825837 RepID=A0A8S5V6Q6_9CAUD|nr:MAG TPA: hypothetical protein [CrAss-like virus sp. ctXt06]
MFISCYYFNFIYSLSLLYFLFFYYFFLYLLQSLILNFKIPMLTLLIMNLTLSMLLFIKL